MLRKISMYSLLLTIAVVFTAFTNTPLKTTTIDTSQSTVTWKGYKVTGSHYGSVAVKSGEMTFEGKKLIGGSFVMDMTSITVDDLKGRSAEKLMGHLKSDDFFGVDKHNTASFKITKATPTANKNEYKITGDMTIKNITNPVTFTATIGKKSAAATIKVDRSKFDVRYGSKSFFNNLGDRTIYDEFDLVVNLVY